MASLTGTAHNSQDLWDLSKRALIQGGGSTTINLFESTNARGATDGIFFYSRGTESGPGEAILGGGQGDDEASPHAAARSVEPQSGDQTAPTHKLAHRLFTGMHWGPKHTHGTPGLHR